MIIETVPHALAPHANADGGALRRPRQVLLTCASWAYLLLLVAVVVTLREAGDRSWVATVLLLSPRWPLAVPLVLLWPWVLLKRSWWHAVVTAASSIVILMPILGLRPGIPDSGGSPGQVRLLRLLTCNVHRQHLDAKELADFIAQVQPNVVALQGWSDINQGSLFQGGGWHVHREGELLVASRFEIQSVVPVDLSDSEGTPAGERGAAAMFELAAPSGSIYLLNLHLASPHAGLVSFGTDKGSKLSGNIERRWRESEIVRGAAERAPGPLLLAGDFNTTDDSPMFRESWSEFSDAFSERGSGFGYTYIIKLTQLRIDHILASGTWEIERCWVGPAAGSPHRPLVADLNLR